MLRLWLIVLSTLAVICGVIGLGLSGAHAALHANSGNVSVHGACTSAAVLRDDLTAHEIPHEIIFGAASVSKYLWGIGIMSLPVAHPTAIVFLTTPAGVWAGVLGSNCDRYSFMVPPAVHKRSLGALMRVA